MTFILVILKSGRIASAAFKDAAIVARRADALAALPNVVEVMVWET